METKDFRALNGKEKEACRMMSKMKSTDNVRFDKCDENDRVYSKAKKLLNGKDPVLFVISVLMEMYGSWTEDYFKNQYKYYLR